MLSRERQPPLLEIVRRQMRTTHESQTRQLASAGINREER